MIQLDLFAGRKRRDRGIAKAQNANAEFVAALRGIAIDMGRTKAFVTADDLRIEAAVRGIAPANGNWNCMGGVFRDGNWECVGYAPSRNVTRHSSLIRIWKLK